MTEVQISDEQIKKVIKNFLDATQGATQKEIQLEIQQMEIEAATGTTAKGPTDTVNVKVILKGQREVPGVDPYVTVNDVSPTLLKKIDAANKAGGKLFLKVAIPHSGRLVIITEHN